MKIKNPNMEFKFRICCYSCCWIYNQTPPSSNFNQCQVLSAFAPTNRGMSRKKWERITIENCYFFFTFAFFFSTRTAIKLRLKSLIVFQMLRKLQIVKPQKQVLSWQWLHTWEEAFPSWTFWKFSQICSFTISPPALPLSHWPEAWSLLDWWLNKRSLTARVR